MRRAAAAVFVCVVVVAVPACRGGDDARARTASRAAVSPAPVPFVTIDPEHSSPADAFIQRDQDRLRAVPDDDGARLELAQAFVQKLRETSDPTFYGPAEQLLRDLRTRRPRNPDVLLTSGILAVSRHRFDAGRQFGARALRVAPRNPTAFGILVDADNELGRYRRALRATQSMLDANPNLPALTRVSYARELRGDLKGAIVAMQQAITAGGAGGGPDVAFAQALLGQLLLTAGDTSGAEAAYAASANSVPNYGPAAAGHAQVLLARGRVADAIPVLEALQGQAPVAQYATDLGDALHAVGRDADAERAYARARMIDRRELENGVDVRVEMAAFDADHDPGRQAVARARAALEARPSALAHDVLAWNLYRIGRIDEATRESRRALALGSRDPRERFHAAAIAFARGDRAAATRHLRIVLAGNPRFDAFLLPEVEELAHRLHLEVPAPVS